MLCLDETISASMPARSRMASSLAASKGIADAAVRVLASFIWRVLPSSAGVSAAVAANLHQPSARALGRFGAGPEQLVDDGIVQRLERGVDDVLRHADGKPRVAGGIGGLDQDAGDGPGAAVEDAHLVVDEFEVGDGVAIDAEVLA